MGLAAQQHRPIAIDWTPAMAETFQEVFDSLTNEGRRNFRDEINQAVLDMVQTGDSRQLNDTLHAWYRSLLVRKAGFEPRLDEQVDPSEAMDIEEVRSFLGV